MGTGLGLILAAVMAIGVLAMVAAILAVGRRAEDGEAALARELDALDGTRQSVERP